MGTKEFEDLAIKVKKGEIVLERIDESFANISAKYISGGRKIVDVKSNQLFTGRFEENDVNEFIKIWKQYGGNRRAILKNQLIQKCDAMITNYHGEVCPIEAMLYTSNVISSRFSDLKLEEEVAEVVYLVLKKNMEFLRSIKHIVNVWEWKHVISVCAISVGKICADKSDDTSTLELMRYIFDRYIYDDMTRRGCFIGVLESKKDEFIPDILNVIHDLTGTESDKIIGNLFKRRFPLNFFGCYNQVNTDMFNDSSRYAKEIVKKVIDTGTTDSTFVGRYQNAQTEVEKRKIIEEGFRYIIDGQGQGIYDAVNMLRLASNTAVIQMMFDALNIENEKGYNSKLIPIISYFGSVRYTLANRRMKGIKYENEYYSACRIALFKQGEITSSELMEGYLTEKRARQLRNYLNGFGGLNDKVTDVKKSCFEYFSRQLNCDDLRCAISNYEQLVRKYKYLYNHDIGCLFMELFGFKTVFNNVKIRMMEQNACLNVIEYIIDRSNYKRYAEFIYYVAEEGMGFSANVAEHAHKILEDLIIPLNSGQL